MPIERINLGNKKDVPAVTFGTGDILITNGYQPGTKLKVLTLAQHIPKPIEEWDKDVPVLDENGERTTDAHDNQIIMYFDNVKSVQNVIHRLEMIIKDLENDENFK